MSTILCVRVFISFSILDTNMIEVNIDNKTIWPW